MLSFLAEVIRVDPIDLVVEPGTLRVLTPRDGDAWLEAAPYLYRGGVFRALREDDDAVGDGLTGDEDGRWDGLRDAPRADDSRVPQQTDTGTRRGSA